MNNLYILYIYHLLAFSSKARDAVCLSQDWTDLTTLAWPSNGFFERRYETVESTPRYCQSAKSVIRATPKYDMLTCSRFPNNQCVGHPGISFSRRHSRKYSRTFPIMSSHRNSSSKSGINNTHISIASLWEVSEGVANLLFAIIIVNYNNYYQAVYNKYKNDFIEINRM